MTVLTYEEVLAMQRKFYLSGGTKPMEFRKKQIRKLKQLIIDNHEMICRAVFKDLHRNAGITNYLELSPAITECDHFLENMEHWAKPDVVSRTFANLMDKPMIVKEPYGVVFLITTWNFPALMFFYPIIAILAAGNTVIIKGSELSESTTNYLAKLINQAFDPEIIAVFTGGADVSTDLLKLPFDKIMYTGNPMVGKIVMEAAAKYLTPVLLELGGKW